MRGLTLEDLEQYQARKAEIDMLMRRRALVRDTVRGSDPEYPHCERPVTISGINLHSAERATHRADWLRARCVAVEDAIAGLGDSTERVTLTMRYIDGCTWQEIGLALGIAESTARARASEATKKIL